MFSSVLYQKFHRNSTVLGKFWGRPRNISLKVRLFLDESEGNLVRYVIEIGGVCISLYCLTGGIAAFQVAVGFGNKSAVRLEVVMPDGIKSK